jgi:hypothetical protein
MPINKLKKLSFDLELEFLGVYHDHANCLGVYHVFINGDLWKENPTTHLRGV